MYKIYFYKENSGKMPVKELLEELKTKGGKDSRVNLRKINDTLNKMNVCGIAIGMPFVRHIDENIWEIRSNRYRIMFFIKNNKEIVLLHYFIKKTIKTPECEIKLAKRERGAYLGVYRNEK